MSRDPEVLGTCELIVDVGGIYDHEKKRYDHHQRDFKETMKSLGVLEEFETKLSSAGLVYAHYGRKVIAAIVELPEDNPTVALLYRKLYEGFVESVDAIDNGIPQFDGVPRYHLASTLGGRVNSLNPDWNEKDVNQDERFTRAMKIVGEEFEDRLRYLVKAWLPAKEMVEKAVEDRRKVHPSGKIIALEQGGVPWKEHFFTLEKERQLEAECITYIIYADDGGDWRVQAIPVDDLQAFENRCPLPEPWRGVRDDKLAEVSGIKDAKFCHVSGFIGGAKTREGALQMAVKSLEVYSKL